MYHIIGDLSTVETTGISYKAEMKRTLNFPLARYFFEIFIIPPKNNIFLDSIKAKSASVETFWRVCQGKLL